MNRLLFVLIICLFSSVALAQEENCAELGTGPSDELIKLIHTMKNDVLGGTPLFCRPKNKQLNDTKIDEAISEYIQKKVSDGKNEVTNLAAMDAIFRVMRYVVMKNLWQVSTADVRHHILLIESCGSQSINKLPIDGPLPPEKSLSVKDRKKRDDKILDVMKVICEASDFSVIIPYLSKDILAEGMFYLSEMFPKQLKGVTYHLCNSLIASTDSIFTITTDEEFYREKDPELIKGFSQWLSKIYINPKPAQSEKKEENANNVIFSEAVPEKFIEKTHQTQGRKKRISELLTEEERRGIQRYTASNYMQLNSCLRNNSCAPNDSKKIDLIKSGLSKIQAEEINKKTITYRGTAKLPESVMKALEQTAGSNNGIVLDKAFMSTSGNLSKAREFMGPDGILFVIISKNCVGVAEGSTAIREDEFLCPPAMKFKVKKPSGTVDIYVLEEVENP